MTNITPTQDLAESESAHLADTKRPTPLTLKAVQDKLRSTEEITPTEKKKIEEFFDEETGEKLPPKRPYVPVVNRLRDNPELQKLKQSLRHHKGQGTPSHNRKKNTK